MNLLSSPDLQPTLRRFLPRGVLLLWLFGLLCLWGWPNALHAAPSAAPLAQAGCSTSMDVGNTAELNNAISCYNGQTTADVYAINFIANITLDSASTVINNTNPGVALRINGDFYMLSGANTYRGLEIAANTYVTIDDLDIDDGKADTSGGGILNHGTLTLNFVLLFGNSAPNGNGGAINNDGQLILSSSTFDDNTARDSGGGILNNGTVTVGFSTFSGNKATDGGGIRNNGTVTVDFSTFSNNTATNGGGGLYNSSGSTLTVSDSYVSTNSASNNGGGIYNAGQLTVSQSKLSGNSATGNSSDGGGIYNGFSSTLTVINSTLSGNSVLSSGGGIRNNGTLAVSNSTLSGNSATDSNSGSAGGGITSQGPLTVTNSTLSDNSATFGGGIYLIGDLTLNNTIIANSLSGGDCYNNGSTITSQTHNLIEDSANSCGIANGANGSIIGQDPALAPLAFNGGSSETHALLAASPAIDQGDAATCTAAPINDLDQIGVIRPKGAACDIGAIEYIPPSVCNFPITVSTTAELNDAIGCYKSRTTADVYTINFSAAITLDTPSTVIDNPTPGVALQINGNGNTLSGANTYRGLEITPDTNVTIDGLTISAGQADTGGGILNYGTLTLNSSALRANSADTGGGIDNQGTLTVTNSLFISNTALFMGGGIWNEGTLLVMQDYFSSNSAADDGGGILNAAGTLTVTNSTFASNTAKQRGGGLYNEAALTLSNSNFSANSANKGGGLYNRSDSMLPLSNSYFLNNWANDGDGGGIYNRGSLTVSHSEISGNSATSPIKADGGGIYNDFGSMLSMTASTLSYNSTRDSGGGIHNRGSLTVSNSTLSSNSAFFGGGMTSFGTLTVTNSTLSANSAGRADHAGGGLNNAGGGKLTLKNTIIANSPLGEDCFNGSSGTVIQTHNLIEGAACGIANGDNGSIIGQDPALAPLDYASFFGPKIHALLATSPAIDQGDVATCSAVPINDLDQIGVSRPQGFFCDIGAVEYIPPTKHALTMSKTGNGSGTVNSTPAGIDCGANCLAIYDQNTTVTLTATPDNGSIFVGWSGDCMGTSACQVTMAAATNVTANFAKVGVTNLSLMVSKAGAGSGTVSSNPNGIDCGATCTFDFPQGTPVILIPAAAGDSIFTGWSGCTLTTGTNCEVTLDTAKSVTANFAKNDVANPILTVSKAGSGSGTVKSTPNGVDCGATCTFAFTQGVSVTLTATPDAGSTFASWSGACSGTAATCTVTLDGAKNVTANFTKANVTKALTVSKAGNGGGTVKSTPSGIDCGATCTFAFTQGASVTLLPTADAGSTFAGWSGCTLTTGTACQVTLDAAKSVVATFTKVNATTPILTVSKAGSGSGGVTSAPAGINCGVTCSAPFTQGSSVTLTAAPDNGSTFGGWSGACSGTTATCTVTMDAAKNVVATFNKVTVTTPTLTVSKAGAGTGKVTSSPAGIDCGATCTFAFTQGSSVTLTAAPDAGSTFAGWSGACSGTATTCTVTLDVAKSVVATFNKVTVTTPILTVSKAGSGSGGVTTSPAGIDCGATCTFAFTQGSSVTLTAASDAGSTFAGWSGACSGTAATCTVTMDAAKSVVATFNKVTVTTPTLTVSKAGAGTGKVTSSPAGIDCGATCIFVFTQGAAVTLTAAPDNGSTFGGWSGACSGTATTCTVTLDSAKTVTATFNQATAQPQKVYLPTVHR